MIAELPAAPPRPRRGRAFMSIVAVTLAALLFAVGAFALLRVGVFYSLYTSLLATVVETTGLDVWASRAIALALVALVWFLPWHLLLIPWIKTAKRQVVSLIILAALATAAMEVVTQDVYFSRADGHPLKYYIQTLDGYKFAALPGTDPVYGIPYQPITADVAQSYMLWKARGGNSQDPTLPEGRYFDPATGQPLRWFAKLPDGRIDMFTLPGFHPTYGVKLLPATTAVVTEYEKQKAGLERQRQEQERIEAAQRTREEAIAKARQEQDRQAQEEALQKQPLQPGRYVFSDLRPSGTVDGFRFALTEADLTKDKLIVHLSVENVGGEIGWQQQKRIRFGLILPDGTSCTFTAIRPKEGALPESNGVFSFPQEGRHGAFVLEFTRPEPLDRTFSIVVNDQPLFSGIDLHRAEFRSF